MSDRYMQDGEIYRNWKASARPEDQITVLTELNGLSKKEVSEIIVKEQKKEKDRDQAYNDIRNGNQSDKALKILEEDLKNNEEETYKRICARLDELDALISGYTKEYKKLSGLLKRKKVK